MSNDLLEQLPELLPVATVWVERQSALIAELGITLTVETEDLAKRVGVKEPFRIRVAFVDEFPLPDDARLRAAAISLGLFGSWMNGITYGYSVALRKGHHTDRALLAHEFRHVAQYENCGSIAAFLQIHLRDLATVGYEDSPFEIDARQHEHHAA